MASSKVLLANQDLQHISYHNANLISMNMDDLLNIYDIPNSECTDSETKLEDYLMKARVVREEDAVKLPPNVSAPQAAVSEGSDLIIYPGGGLLQFGNIGGGGGRGKRKVVVVEDPSVDKATQQKQRRMIKNRESAARSRERKQAYMVELESLVTQLEEEHARLLKQMDELNKERHKQSMENLMPVEKRRYPRVLRRINSM